MKSSNVLVLILAAVLLGTIAFRFNPADRANYTSAKILADAAAADITALASRVAAVENKTSTWNTASTVAVSATNRVFALEALSNSWVVAAAAVSAGQTVELTIPSDGTNYTLQLSSGVVTNTVVN
jgi:hypothetical protein